VRCPNLASRVRMRRGLDAIAVTKMVSAGPRAMRKYPNPDATPIVAPPPPRNLSASQCQAPTSHNSIIDTACLLCTNNQKLSRVRPAPNSPNCNRLSRTITSLCRIPQCPKLHAKASRKQGRRNTDATASLQQLV
jgi:hypothetical protein